MRFPSCDTAFANSCASSVDEKHPVAEFDQPGPCEPRNSHEPTVQSVHKNFLYISDLLSKIILKV